MDVYHTEKELISLPELEKRWSLDAEELARIYVEDSLTVFFVKKIRKANDSYYFLGIENKYDNVHEAIGDFSFETHIIKTNEGDKKMEIFLLFSEILEYEKKKPYLLGNPVVADYKTAVDSTVKSDTIPPMSEQEMLSWYLIEEAKNDFEGYTNRSDTPSPIGRQSEEQDNERVAELEEQLARAKEKIRDYRNEIERLKQELASKSVAQDQGMDAEQAEALEAEKAAHAETRKKLDATKEALKAATKEPVTQAKGTLFFLIHALLMDRGIDCRTIDFSSKNPQANALEEMTHRAGHPVTDRTIREKILQAIQRYLENVENG